MIQVYAFKIGDYGDDPHKLTNGVYLHGNLMDENGFDLVSLSEIPEEDGIYDCTALGQKAKLFYWSVPFDNGVTFHKGLVVAESDEKNLKDAKRKYNRRAEFI